MARTDDYRQTEGANESDADDLESGRWRIGHFQRAFTLMI